MAEISIVSYNILSSALASPSFYSHCAEEDLLSLTRLLRIYKKLDQSMTEHKTRPIICLQEVSREWEGPLHVFFSRRNYHFITSLSGPAYQGYMGVAMAIPEDVYQLKDTSIKRIADTKQVPKIEEPKPSSHNLFIHKAQAIFDTCRGIKREKETCPWEDSLKRHNTMISARVVHQRSGKAFCIGTYHMPCAYWAPQVMVIHTALAFQHLQEFAQGDEHIFAGDFNFGPHSQPYELITKNNPMIDLKKLPNDVWFPLLKTVMQDAYAQIDKQPEITNYATTNGKPCFAGVLDYIFISPGLTCKSVLELPSLDELKKQCTSLPNAHEPSDHLLIGALLTFQ